MNDLLPGLAEKTSSHRTCICIHYMGRHRQGSYSSINQLADLLLLHLVGTSWCRSSCGVMLWPREHWTWGSPAQMWLHTAALHRKKDVPGAQRPKDRSISYPLYQSQGDKNLCSSHLITVWCAAELCAVLSWLLAWAACKMCSAHSTGSCTV